MEQIFQKKQLDDFRELIKMIMGKIFTRSPNSYAGKKAKNAQEAHEAIRPTDVSRKPADIKKYVNADQV